jgi:S1-C subfamily serine protease
MNKVYGVLRVFNTLENGGAVAGLEAGSAVLSSEATEAANKSMSGIIAITNHHVVGENREVFLNFYFNETPFPATVIKVFPQSDIAFLHINTNNKRFKNANFDTSLQKQRKIRLIDGCSSIGSTIEETLDTVVSVGYPSGTSHQNITQGHITTVGEMCDDIMLNHTNFAYYHDCVINHGNSGGALLKDGRLIGINRAIKDPSKFNTVSIAIPFQSIEGLFKYIEPDNSHPELSPEAYMQLMSLYHVHVPLQNLMDNFEAHQCGGVKSGNVAVTFADWFHDCVINHGNSGGALLKDGRLIGINRAIKDPSKLLLQIGLINTV